MSYQCRLFYQNKPRGGFHVFPTKEQAMRFFESKQAAFKFGLVGWSVSYPAERKEKNADKGFAGSVYGIDGERDGVE